MASEHTGSLEMALLDISIQPGPVVTICGEIDILTVPQLQERLLHMIRWHGPQLTLELSGVTFIDCAGINALLSIHRRAELEGGSLRVLRASPCVRRVIALTHLDPVLMPTAALEAVAS